MGLLMELCARCHAVGRIGRSLHSDGPPLRIFGDGKLYNEDLDSV
jgi:hypothetical protein